MSDSFSAREVVTWAVSGVAVIVSALGRQVWKGYEDRMDEVEGAVKRQAHDLTHHAVGDVAAHDKLREDLAVAVEKLNDKIDDRSEALSTQMATQHSVLSGQIFEILKLIKGGQ